MDSIISKLPDIVGNLTVEKDGTEAKGTCDGYEYIITEEYEVIMGGKIGAVEIIRLGANKIGTSTCTVEVKITNLKVEKTEFQYYVNGTKVNTSIQGQNYKIENLNPETEYTIYAIVIDKEGKQTQTNSVKVKTEARTYIYKDGQYSDLVTDWINGGVYPGNGVRRISKIK